MSALVNILLVNPEGEACELFLGYKDYPTVVNHLKNILISLVNKEEALIEGQLDDLKILD